MDAGDAIRSLLSGGVSPPATVTSGLYDPSFHGPSWRNVYGSGAPLTEDEQAQLANYADQTAAMNFVTDQAYAIPTVDPETRQFGYRKATFPELAAHNQRRFDQAQADARDAARTNAEYVLAARRTRQRGDRGFQAMIDEQTSKQRANAPYVWANGRLVENNTEALR